MVVVPGPSSRLTLTLALALEFAGVACGRSMRHESGPTPSAGESGGSGGAAGAGSGGGGLPAMTQTLPPKEPLEVRHVTVGAPAPPGCVTSVVETASGVRIAGGGTLPFVSTSAGSPESDAAFETMRLEEGTGAALVFGDASGQVVAWSEPPDLAMSFELFDAGGTHVGSYTSGVPGQPLAAGGTTTDFRVAFTDFGDLSLYSYGDGSGTVLGIEEQRCVDPHAIAVGMLDGDVVVAYFCGALIVARIAAETGEIERTTVDLLPESGDLVSTSVPGLLWRDDELLVAHVTATGETALSHVMPGEPMPRTELVNGMPPLTSGHGQHNPLFSLAGVGDDLVLTRAACNEHEDARATGRFNLCKVSAQTLEATCSDVEAPCQESKVVSYGEHAALLGCDGEAPAFVPLELAAIPDEQPGFFPAGYSTFEPLALSCDGEHCSGLLRTNTSRVVNGYDERLTFADIELGEDCNDGRCPGAVLAPTELCSVRADSLFYEPSIALERQPDGLPIGIVTIDPEPDGRNYHATLSLLDRGGIAWAEPVLGSQVALFGRDDDFLGLGSELLSKALYPYSASESGVVALPEVQVSSGALDLTTPAFCNGRLLIHGTSQESSVARPKAAILAYDPATSELRTLFDPGVFPAESGHAPRTLGCAGERVLMLDGLTVHQYSIAGQRGADLTLNTPPASMTGDVIFTALVTRKNDVLVASANAVDNVLQVLKLDANGENRAYALPLAGLATVPLVALAVAPDTGDGWLRVLYQSRDETYYAAGRGYVYASAFRIAVPE